MEKLIALCADGGCGKTSVLLWLAHLIDSDSTYSLVSKTIPIPSVLPPPNKDGVFTFIRGNKTVRVVTAGDDPQAIGNALDQADLDEVDWYVGASRAKHSRTDEYERFAALKEIIPLYMFCPWIDRIGRTREQKIHGIAAQIKEIIESSLPLW